MTLPQLQALYMLLTVARNETSELAAPEDCTVLKAAARIIAERVLDQKDRN